MSLDSWQWRSPVPQGNPLDGVAFGSGKFVAVSRAGTIMQSADTASWSINDLGTGISAVRFLNNRFVAVANSGIIFTSPDAVNWSAQVSGTSAALLDVAYGNGKYVAVGQCAAITTSPDGANWTAQSSGTVGTGNEKYYGIAFGNGLFLLVGLNGTVLQSANGTLWVDKSLPAQDDLVAITFGGGHFVAAHNSGEMLRSVDGAVWQRTALTGNPGITGVDYVNGRFVAVGMKVVNGERVGAIFTSSDGLTWGEQTSGVGESLFGAAYGNGTYLIGGFGGTILTSGNASNWVRKNSDSSALLTGLAYGNGTFIAVGRRYGGVDGVSRHPVMFSSSDLLTWTQIASPADEPLSDVVYTGSDSAPGSFVAVGGWGSVLVSDDGSNWQKHSAQRTMSAIAVHDGTLVAVGGFGTILRSTDKVSWSLRGAGSQAYLHDVIYGAGRFVAVGDGGTLLMSLDDGQSWAQQSSGTTATLRGVAFGDGRFVTVADSGEVLTSTNGQSWTLQNESLGMHGGFEVYYSEQIPGFMALGLDGRMATSPDGASWTARNCGTSNGLLAGVFGNGSFFVAGDGCTVLQSEVIAPLRVQRPIPSAKIPQKSGSRVTWHCAASGRPNLHYAFTLTKVGGLRPPGPQRELLRFQTQADFVCTLNSRGTYVVTVHVRDQDGNVIRRSSVPFVVRG
ncbi:hypothetical protein EG829_02405 [bacterium]|nr:hypothetical protein [bacterium]